MINGTVSQYAVNLVLSEIREGKTYPDFWDNRYTDVEETEQPQESTGDTEENKAAQA